MLSNKLYDILKWMTMIVLPAASTFYASLSGIWGWGYTEEVVMSLGAVTTFLGVLLGISTVQYHKTK